MEGSHQPIHLRVVVFREGDSWIAQCLEHDICSQASSVTELHTRFVRTLFANVAVCIELGREPLQGIGAAPRRYWDMFEQSTIELKNLDPEPELPRFTDSPPPRFEPAIRLADMYAHN